MPNIETSHFPPHLHTYDCSSGGLPCVSAHPWRVLWCAVRDWSVLIHSMRRIWAPATSPKAFKPGSAVQLSRSSSHRNSSASSTTCFDSKESRRQDIDSGHFCTSVCTCLPVMPGTRSNRLSSDVLRVSMPVRSVHQLHLNCVVLRRVEDT